MRAGYGDKEVCPKCNGTGYRVYRMRGGSYTVSVPCTFKSYGNKGQLPLTAIRRELGRKSRTGNRWHTKN